MGNRKNELTFWEYLKAIGPGAIMAACIIGPGTVTTASVQGADYGYTAIWLILAACIIAYFYQEPAIRISIGRKENVMVGVREQMGPKTAAFLYIVIFMGSIAFQAGNLAGASMGLTYLFPGTNNLFWAITMSVAALAVIMLNKYSVIEKINIVLVLMMVFAFVITAIYAGPGVGTLITEGFTFKVPGGNFALGLGLMATTVTPNLILGYSGFLRRKYPNPDNSERLIKLNQFDLALNMGISFLITAAILVCAAAVIRPLGIKISSAGDMAVQLTPTLGKFAGVLFSVGLWAAAFSSIIYQVSLHEMLLPRAFNLDTNPKARHNVLMTFIVVLVPVIFTVIFGASPVGVIVVAQILNGIALPFVFIVSWILCTKKEFMGEYVNKGWQNIVMGAMTALTLLFALNTLRNVISRFL